MNHYLTLLIAYRYVTAALYKKNSRILLLSAFVSICIATSTTLLVYTINKGFEKATLATLKGVHADIIMSTAHDYIATDTIEHVIHTEFPTISATSPYALEQGLLKPKRTMVSKPMAAFIKIIDPDKEAATTSLETKLITPAKLRDICTTTGGIVIGHSLAHSLALNVGDTTELVLVREYDQATPDSIDIVSLPVHIGGIVKTGIEELDTALVLINAAWYQEKIPGSGFTHLSIHSTDNNNKKLCATLQKRFAPLHVYEWVALYPSLLSALTLEHWAFTLIMTIIIIIAAISIIAVIAIIISAKHSDMAILYLAGTAPDYLKYIFITIGLFINSIAVATGITLAWIITALLQCYPITLPDAYYTTTVPVSFDYRASLAICIGSTLISIAVTLLTTQMIQKESIIETIKQE